MNKQHPYAEILRLIADGAQMQWQDCDGEWFEESSAELLLDIAQNSASPITRYRVKPDVIIINGIEVPKPLQDHPPELTFVFWPQLCSLSSISSNEYYSESKHFQSLLRRGLLHLTPEAAKTHALALLSFTTTNN